MSLYLISPKASLLEKFPALSARTITAAQRTKQLKEVAQAWQENQTYQEIQRWIEDAEDFDVKRITSPIISPNLTGTTLVEMSDEEAARIEEEIDNIVILKDRDIDLIRPIQNTTPAKDKLTASDIWHLEAIKHSLVNQTGKEIKIAVFDTGIDINHPEIKGKIAEAYEFNNRQKTIEKIELEDYIDTDDEDGHGTHVAGLICGNNVGVAPGAEIVSITMIPNGRGSLINFTIALQWLLSRPDIRVVNISAGLSEPRYFQPMSAITDSLLALGILPICAVGNEGRNNACTPGNCLSVVSVGATNNNDKVAGFSGSARMLMDNKQYNVPSLVAPGDEIYSSIPGGKYKALPGTSMATPIVSGIAALILEANPQISVYDLREELLRSCKKLEELPERQGKGIIQVRV
ncbi:MAG: S8/S53 family peptidase [Cyanobacteria bacterium P01_F01_bin.143]